MEPRRRCPSLTVSAGALGLGLAIGMALPLGWSRWVPAALDPAGPEGYVAVLAAPEGRTGVVVSARAHGHVLVTALPMPPEMPAGRTLYLWAIGATGAARPVGPVPPAASGEVALGRRADALFADAVELAVSLERAGATPDLPAGPYVYRGRCGRLWPVATRSG